MNHLKTAIQECLRKRAEVYRIEPERMQRDLASARGTIKDHSGRWFFELIQNSDDAQAAAVEVHITDDAVYVCDDGKGLSPAAVESISGTYFSDKATDTIGHKGIGFKAVYEITDSPEIYSGGNEGLIFSEAEARRWFDEKCLTPPVQGIPYEWVPIFRSRSTAEDRRPYLRSLHAFSTVVVLPFRSDSMRSRVIETLEQWPAEILLPFNHLHTLRIQNTAAELDFDIEVRRDADRWITLDSRSGGQRHWWVTRKHCRPPSHVLSAIDPYDRDRASEISVLLAAPITEDAAVPTDDYPNLHVFYPTEQQAPVRLLIHAEFLLKSDRTAIVPIQSNQFNSWIAEEVADLLVQFVNDAYSRRDPASFLRLLLPSDQAENEDGGTPARHLWERVRSAASERLLLPDTECDQQLRLEDALLVSVSDPAAARGILHRSALAPRLVHESFDDNREAQRALRKLGCTELRDSDVVNTISEEAANHCTDQDWVWACWRWLAAWLTSSTDGADDRRLEVIQDLPIIPVDSGLKTPASLRKSIVTWRPPDGSAERLPEWLPIVFVRDWFRDRILSEDDALKGLLAKLRIAKPGEDVVIRGLEKGIHAYWGEPDDNPICFLRFLLSQQWGPSTDLARLSACPVPVRLGENDEIRWRRADASYFGEAWGEAQLPLLYSGDSTVPWVQPVDPDCCTGERDLLQRMGVVGYPRVIEDGSEAARQTEERRVFQLLDSYTGYPRIPDARVLDRVDLAELGPQAAACIIRLVSKYWNEYYEEQHTQLISYFYYSERSRTVDALWWHQLVTKLRPPLENAPTSQTPLPQCWVPDKDVRRLLGDLIPIVDLGAFEEDAEKIRDWLVQVVNTRRTLGYVPRFVYGWGCALCCCCVVGAVTGVCHSQRAAYPTQSILSIMQLCRSASSRVIACRLRSPPNDRPGRKRRFAS